MSGSSPHGSSYGGGNRLRIAVVCSSNQNRSMEAHSLLLKKGFNVRSYGTGKEVKLPGPSIDRPNIFSFGTPYQKIYDELRAQNPDLYRQNGLLHMLERNMKIKTAPERWQDQSNVFDVIITFEERVFDTVIEDFSIRGSVLQQPVHLFNLSVKDNHEDAAVGAAQTYMLCQMLESSEDWEDRIDDIIEEFQRRTNRSILHSTLFY